MTPSHLDFRRLRQVPIADILAARGIHLAARGPRLVGPCPVHGGDNPNAFVVSSERNLWYCFTRCAAGGDAIDLVRRLDGCSFPDAARYLASLDRCSQTLAPQPPLPPAPALLFQPYTRRLRLDPHADLLRIKGIRPQTAYRFEVGRYHGPGFLEGCVGVRLDDPRGLPLGYAGRRLDSNEAARLGKWKLPLKLPRSTMLYNLHRVARLIPAHGVVLVECPWAVLRLAQIHIPAVGLLGCHISAQKLLYLHNARRIVILLDGDQPGRIGAERIRQQLPASSCAVVHLPDGTDPDDLSDLELSSLLRPLFLP